MSNTVAGLSPHRAALLARLKKVRRDIREMEENGTSLGIENVFPTLQLLLLTAGTDERISCESLVLAIEEIISDPNEPAT